MALNLDARQRAMLQAMGITVWLPEPVEPAAVLLSLLPPPHVTGSRRGAGDAPARVRRPQARQGCRTSS
jgi:DNA polymerase